MSQTALVSTTWARHHSRRNYKIMSLLCPAWVSHWHTNPQIVSRWLETWTLSAAPQNLDNYLLWQRGCGRISDERVFSSKSSLRSQRWNYTSCLSWRYKTRFKSANGLCIQQNILYPQTQCWSPDPMLLTIVQKPNRTEEKRWFCLVSFTHNNRR